MSYTNFDFPHSHFYDDDLRELLHMYKVLTEEYARLVADVKAIQEWEADHKLEYQALLVKISELENEIAAFEVKVQAMFDGLEAEFENKFATLKTELTNEVNTAVAQFEILANELREEVEYNIAQLKNELNRFEYDMINNMSEFKDDMEELLEIRFQEFIANLPDYENLIVHNPVRGYDTTIQIALDDLYNHFNVFGLTAEQFDSLELTAQEFDNAELTAHEFDSMGYKLLNYPDPNYYMLDPFSGEVIPVKDVVMKLFNLHRTGITAANFDALELTVNEFEAKNLTAFMFDFMGVA